MVKITNGIKTVEVSNSAYREIFAPMGFYEVGNEITQPKSEKPIQDKSVASGDEIEPKADSDIEDILTKPISTWSSEEIRKIADAKQIDTSSANTVKQARAIVREALGM
jgi:hypothetical protein